MKIDWKRNLNKDFFSFFPPGNSGHFLMIFQNFVVPSTRSTLKNDQKRAKKEGKTKKNLF